MEHQATLKKYLQTIVGKKLDRLRLACEMMCFSFEEYALHAQCLTRIIYKNDILVTTTDYYNCDGKVEENNDEWYFVGKYKAQIQGGIVKSVNVSPLHDIEITMDNGIRIELFIENGYHHFDEEREQWTFFKEDDYSYPFISVGNKTVNIKQEE